MSSVTKHFFSSQDGLVASALRGLAATNPSLAVLEHDKILFHANHDPKKVSLLSGGGSGHEPAHSGYVGEGMLAAAVCGDIFASPSTKQIQTACEAVKSEQGYIFIVTNYTGDMLHFGLAAEKINASGYGRAGIVKAADDVSVGREHGGLVGRRGLSGTIVINKLLGGAAMKLGFDDVLKLGQAVADSLVTINAGLDHCHVPGRGDDYGQLKKNQIEIGLGIHNEPGVQLLDHIPEAGDIVKKMLDLALDQSDKDRAFVKFNKDDKVALLINNLGGVPLIEQLGLTDLVMTKLGAEYDVHPSRVYSGHFMTSLNAPIFAITLLNISHAARESGRSEAEVLSYLDAPTTACSWPANHYQSSNPIDIKQQLKVSKQVSNKGTRTKDLKVEPKKLESLLRLTANNVIKAEPALTEWDTKMGDGDCGKTLEAGSNALLQSLDNGLAKPGSILDVLEDILDITEDKMGGTLGAIFGIYFAAFVSSLKALLADIDVEKANVTEVIAKAASEALANLRTHTPASEGDRTVMDVLIPFIKTFSETNSIEQGCETAKKAAEGTKLIKPKLGRATYVGGLDELSVLPPDPGAWALYEIVRGLCGLENEAA